MSLTGNQTTHGQGSVGVSVAPSYDLTVIHLPVSITPDAPDHRSELSLLRDALLFYAEHLDEKSNQQQRPDIRIDAANVSDMLENLTQQAFNALSERSQLLLTLPWDVHEKGKG